jgi:hypothetical protein
MNNFKKLYNHVKELDEQIQQCDDVHKILSDKRFVNVQYVKNLLVSEIWRLEKEKDELLS